MARYIQRITLLGKERWIGWEIDGVGTEVPGLQLADDLTDEDLRARGIKDFHPLAFESFLGMGLNMAGSPADGILDEDVAFRLDGLQVAMERLRSAGKREVPRSMLAAFFVDDLIGDSRVQQRFEEWERAGAIERVGTEDCYLRIMGTLR